MLVFSGGSPVKQLLFFRENRRLNIVKQLCVLL